MKKAPLFGIAALLLVGLVAAGAFAMPFGGFGKRGMFGSNDAMKEAMEAGDYNAYMTAIEESWKAYKAELTEEKFNEIVEHYKLMAEKRVAMQESREQRYQEMAEKRDVIQRKREGMQEKRAEIEQAMNEGYDAWKVAIADSPFGEKMTEGITEENFDTFVQMHNARKDEDHETAKALAEELGLNCNMGKGMMRKGFGRFH